MVNTTPALHFLNLSYFFQLAYNAFLHGHTPVLTGLATLAGTIWFWVTIFAYLFSIACIGILVYYSIRLSQVEEEIDELYATIPEKEAHERVEHSRWKHIRELIESPHENDWRSAIIEADIMLDEMLSRQGYEGAGVGEKLKMASPHHFHSLQDAWEAHKVRNDVAHRGTEYKLSPNIAYRTIGLYENVFREFGEI